MPPTLVGTPDPEPWEEGTPSTPPSVRAAGGSVRGRIVAGGLVSAPKPIVVRPLATFEAWLLAEGNIDELARAFGGVVVRDFSGGSAGPPQVWLDVLGTRVELGDYLLRDAEGAFSACWPATLQTAYSVESPDDSEASSEGVA